MQKWVRPAVPKLGPKCECIIENRKRKARFPGPQFDLLSRRNKISESLNKIKKNNAKYPQSARSAVRVRLLSCDTSVHIKLELLVTARETKIQDHWAAALLNRFQLPLRTDGARLFSH